MYHMYLGDSENRSYLDQAIQARAEAQGRVAYLAIVGIEAAAVFIGRAAMAGLRGATRRYRQWNDRRVTIRELSKLDDRMLRDVGVDPYSLELLATELTQASRQPSSVGSLVEPGPTVPLLSLDLDCPGLKHAA